MRQHRSDGERILAVFIDFENVGLGFGNRRDRFNIEKVMERLVEKGKIVAKKAYADWSRFSGYASSLHAAAVELVEIPKRVQTGKNSADIRMCVDAMDLAYSKDHIDTFVIVSGDSDFSPLVSKLKELGKHVIGLGLVDSTSDLLRDNCDEFIYYEDLDRAPLQPLAVDVSLPEGKRKVFALLVDSLLALRRENKEVIFSSMVKDTMKRKKPSFNEEYHGYRTFSDLLEDAQRHGIVELERHKTSGTYVVTRFGSELKGSPAIGPSKPAALPPAQKPAALPARQPAAEKGPPAEPRNGERRGGGRRGEQPKPAPARQPAKAAPPAEPIEPVEPDEDRLPLGRALIEDIDDLDDVPSYMPRKAPPEEAAPKKPAARAEKPVATAGRGQQTAKAEPAKPATGQSAGSKGRGGRGRQPKAERQAKEEKPSRQSEVPAVRPTADDDSDFGAGLDL